MRGYRVFDVIENRYSDKEFFIDKDGVLFKVGNTALNNCDFMVQLDEADTDRYIVEEGTEVEGVRVFHNDVCFVTDPYIEETAPDEIKKFFKRKFKVVWDGLKFQIELIHNDVNVGVIRLKFPREAIIEVVGTVHDNPELLEQPK